MMNSTAAFNTGHDCEDKEQMLERQLKRITKEGHKDKERQKAIEAYESSQQVIQRVKQLLQLPPEHVSEKGCFSNPMRGHKDELIFTRVTGHPNIPENNVWFDTSECWVCAKHNKLSVTVSMVDKVID